MLALGSVVALFPLGVTEKYALNPLDGKTYPHHPVMLQVPSPAYPLELGLITELNGLRVPAHFDCENLCNVSQWDRRKPGPSRCPFGSFRYYLTLPSRWHSCHEHEAFLKSRFSHVHVRLPLIDEEYVEQVAVYQSALRARGSYHVMELGARWGTWGARSIAFLRLQNPMPYQLFLVEPLRVHCAGADMVLKLNKMSGTLKCAMADAALFLQLMSSVDHLDLLHIDIQGAEGPLLSDARVQQVLSRKVYRIIVGTHWEEMHRFVAESFKDWITVFSLPQGFWDCMKSVGLVPLEAEVPGRLQPIPPPSREAWDRLRAQGCYHNTPKGMIANIDGSFILDNPRFVNASRPFSLSDTELRTDDLMK